MEVRALIGKKCFVYSYFMDKKRSAYFSFAFENFLNYRENVLILKYSLSLLDRQSKLRQGHGSLSPLTGLPHLM